MARRLRPGRLRPAKQMVPTASFLRPLCCLISLVAWHGGHRAAAATEEARTIVLKEVSDSWRIDFRHHHGGSGERYMVESVVGGVVLFDFDGDGDDDIFFVDGGALPGYEGEAPRSRLFRNDGRGLFYDFTARAGIDFAGYGCGASAGDYDNDGALDLYLTAFGRNALYRNQGDGTFVDMSAEAGVDDALWSSSAAFADVDRDGDLDLYVANYVDFSLTNTPPHCFSVHFYACGLRSLYDSSGTREFDLVA